ncbi:MULTISPECIES: hypothetical protein [Pandoraea]|uniref:hypothetical protein n=1 Tax=Pandoraea TaxID=93217 RepID=UPI0008472F89|nr:MULTISPECIES: hypothetical protein [Pandoraea]ODP34708.1 hypothetical protein A9762_13945 [Pandoraea sp. ISTKB]
MSKFSTGMNAGAAAAGAAGAAGNTGMDTASAIAQINAAAEAENEINLATTYAQLREAGPKNMKSLTQG